MIEAITVWAVITSGSVDIGGGIVFGVNLPDRGRGVALPHIAVADGPVSHELVHLRQWDALGPAFPLAYALVPTEFEDYRGDGFMWSPPSNLRRNCPLIRFDFKEGISLAPCWRIP